jgi:hypothetical protein
MNAPCDRGAKRRIRAAFTGQFADGIVALR